MWTQFGDFDRTFALLDDLLRRRVDRAAAADDTGYDGWRAELYTTDVWPRVNLQDGASSVTLTADVPGLSEKDLHVEVTGDSLTLSGERKIEVPEGYATHRRERGGFKFSRSFTLPFKISPDETSASVKDGVLTLVLAKSPDAQPRQIAVKAGA